MIGYKSSILSSIYVVYVGINFLMKEENTKFIHLYIFHKACQQTLLYVTVGQPVKHSSLRDMW